MQTKNYVKLAALLLGAHLFATTLCADGDPQLSISTGSRLFDAKKGADLYAASCQACHMADGKGANAAGMYPSLVSNMRLMSAKTTLETVTNGLRGMPAFRGYLSDDQIVEVVSFVRTNFGNNFTSVVSAADIPKQ